CFDNSPTFDEVPSTVICTGYPFTYIQIAFDVELDSLVYSWAQPMSGVNQPITNFSPGYTWNSPLPGPAQNPNNVAATINAQTGEISFTSYTNGAFVTVTKVTAYKCGIKVAEIFREMQVVLLSCGANNPPDVTPPFANSSGQYVNYIDTVRPGDFVSFTIAANDSDLCPNSTPQTMSLYATGPQFAAPVNPGGCFNPPCATLLPVATPANPITGIYGVQTTFSWQTDCNHLNNKRKERYCFLFKVRDDFCPVPGKKGIAVYVDIIDPSIMDSPDSISAFYYYLPYVSVWWTQPADPEQSFQSYIVWVRYPPNKNFIPFDTITNFNHTLTVFDASIFSQNTVLEFYVTVKSGCGGSYQSMPLDTAILFLPLSVENMSDNTDLFIVKPNPAHDLINVSTTEYTGSVDYVLVNALGCEIKKGAWEITAKQSLQIDCSNFIRGIYFLVMTADQRKYSYKLLLE
ncbi:MAG: T9SS type A sorting domain-containing protein, partial [Bacteroidales bacterium]|nr:T9SS type A sorting domain-containing protein [Bacteroidales bacterium]